MVALGCCGDDCNYCLRFFGTKTNDTNELKKAAEIWFKMGWTDRLLSPNEIRCSGCSSSPSCFYEVKECCEKKKIDNCSGCPKYACEKLKKVFKRTRQYEEKSKLMLTKDVYELFRKAFYRKEEYLNKIRQKNEVVKK